MLNQFNFHNLDDEESHIEEIKQARIHSGDGGVEAVDLTKSTEVSNSGDVKIKETKLYFIQRGDRVTLDGIIGQCTIETCRQWLTARTLRECICTKILCPEHTKWDEKEQNYFCMQCYRDLRWVRFWKSLWSISLMILSAPFRRSKKK